ncbi:MAG: protoporphyrinogen oxidase [Gemmatimonadetes bacterium]|nr:protoporphyrinogen oxidase [Gemmatimonadota bacterium]NIO32794.1 protoporphyrinogen oxidase [Gemmatimonadota bacterium]
MAQRQGEVKRVAVVGGGIAGLAAGYELAVQARERGFNLSLDLFESSGRLGGAILTERVDDYVLDAGPDAVLTLKPWGLELCREIGLEDEIIPTQDEHRGVALYSRGRLRSLPYGTGSSAVRKIRAYMASGVVSWPAKLRMAADLVLPRGVQKYDESMADFFGRRLGREAVERIVDPLIAGIYSGDPDKLSIYSTFPRFPQMVAKRRSILLSLLRAPQSARSGTRTLPIFCSLRGGLGRMVEAIVERLGGTQIHLSTPATAVVKTDSGYSLETHAGRHNGYAGLILATPAWTTARLLGDLAPGPADKLKSIRYVSSATVFFAYRASDLGGRPRGFGFLVPACEGRRINGATWITNKFAHRSPGDGFLARCFIGGDRTGEEMRADDDGLVRICREELRDIAGITAQPLFTRVYRWKDSGPQYDVGHASLIGEVDAALAEHPGLEVTGAGFRGIGIPDCVYDGRETARRLIQFLAN